MASNPPLPFVPWHWKQLDASRRPGCATWAWASVLHISSNTLRHKLLGETQFKLDEAERLSTMLGLTMAERDACFFDAENRFSRSATLELPKRGKRQ